VHEKAARTGDGLDRFDLPASSIVPAEVDPARPDELLGGLHIVTGKDWDADFGRGIVNAAASYSALHA